MNSSPEKEGVYLFFLFFDTFSLSGDRTELTSLDAGTPGLPLISNLSLVHPILAGKRHLFSNLLLSNNY